MTETDPADEFELASVRIAVSALRPVRRKCDIRYTATVEVFLGDISIYGPTDGWTLRLDRSGKRLRANQPAFRDPDSGEWRPVFPQMPLSLLHAIAEEMLRSVEGGTVVRLAASETPSE
jgi:hypothetical protein